MNKTNIKTRSTKRDHRSKGDRPPAQAAPLQKVKAEIDKIRRGVDPECPVYENGSRKKLKGFEVNRRVSEVIASDMTIRGAFFCEGELGYYLDKSTRLLIDLGQKGLDLEALLGRYGLNPTERLFDYVVAELFKHAVQQGQKSTVHHFSHLDLPDDGEPVLYISAEENNVWRIKKDSKELVANGTDGVLFLSSDYSAPADIPGNSSEEGDLLEPLILDRVPFDTEKLTREESKFMLRCEILALVMREIVTDTRPIYAFIGEKGSGKTTTVRMFGKTLYGPEWDVHDVAAEAKDFDALVTSQPFVCLDNADENINWLNNKLATTASGGKVPRRVLYTTNRFADYPIVSMIATTSRTPWFRRDDVADRLVILRTLRLSESDQGDFKSDVLGSVLSKRKELWPELISQLQAILRVLDETDWRSVEVPRTRLQEFARFTVVVGRANGCEDLARGIWRKLTSAQEEFVAEGEFPFDVLSLWVKGNPGREVTTGELNPELTEIAEDQGVLWPCSSGYSLGQKLVHTKHFLTDLFDMSERMCPGRNQTVYRFWPKGQSGVSRSPDATPGATPVAETRINTDLGTTYRSHRSQNEGKLEKTEDKKGLWSNWLRRFRRS